jgi:hypothetical protein
MTFDNSRTIISLRIRLFIATVLLLGYIVLSYIAEIIKFPLLGLSDTFLTVILVIIYLILAFYPMALNYQYIYYSDDGDFIIFRYYFAGIVSGKKNSIEINKRSFAGYKKESEFFGLDQSLILYQQLAEGVAKYPPVHISILNRKERAKVLNSLYLHTPKNEAKGKNNMS